MSSPGSPAKPLLGRKCLCVLVANESTGTLYLREHRRAPLVEYATLDNETARERLRELTSDKPGRSFDSHGHGRHAMADQQDAKEHAALRFAGEIVQTLESGRARGDVGDYVLIAAPRFLGLLRKAITRTALGGPALALSKDIAGQPAAAAERLLSENQARTT